MTQAILAAMVDQDLGAIIVVSVLIAYAAILAIVYRRLS